MNIVMNEQSSTKRLILTTLNHPLPQVVLTLVVFAFAVCSGQATDIKKWGQDETWTSSQKTSP